MSQPLDQAGTGIQPAQEGLAERLLEKVRECQDFSYAYHFTTSIRELSCYEGSAAIQGAYLQALLSCSEHSPDSIPWEEVLAELSCTPDFASNSSSQLAYIAVWRRFCSNSAYKIRPMALLQNLLDLPERKQCPEVEMSLAKAICGAYTSFSKTLKLEWLERLSSFSQFESDNEQGLKLREIFSEILRSTDPSSEAAQGAESERPLGPRQGQPGDCTSWRVEMSQSHFENSICILPYSPYNPNEFAKINFSAKSAAYIFEDRPFEEVDLKNLTELVLTESSSESCGDTTFFYTLEFRSAGIAILCLHEEETYGEWDRALPFLSSPIQATARALAERLAVPLICN